MRESRKQLKARLYKQRQRRANTILRPVKDRIIREQQLRTNARVKYYNDIPRRRNARECDFDTEEILVPPRKQTTRLHSKSKGILLRVLQLHLHFYLHFHFIFVLLSSVLTLFQGIIQYYVCSVHYSLK
jgi:hypothetical protein